MASEQWWSSNTVLYVQWIEMGVLYSIAVQSQFLCAIETASTESLSLCVHRDLQW